MQANSDDVPSTPGADAGDGEASEPATPKVLYGTKILFCDVLRRYFFAVYFLRLMFVFFVGGACVVYACS